MNLSRRSFLRGVLSVAAVSSVPLIRAMPVMPIIYGDGIGDDTAGLQALFDGLPVDIRSDVIRLLAGEHPIISGGIFRLTDGLVVSRGRSVTMSDCNLLLPHSFAKPLFEAKLNGVLELAGEICVKSCSWTGPPISWVTSSFGGQVCGDPVRKGRVLLT